MEVIVAGAHAATQLALLGAAAAAAPVLLMLAAKGLLAALAAPSQAAWLATQVVAGAAVAVPSMLGQLVAIEGTVECLRRILAGLAAGVTSLVAHVAAQMSSRLSAAKCQFATACTWPSMLC